MMLTVLLLVCLLLVVRVHAEDIFVSNSYTNSSCSVSVRECPDVASALRISSSFDSIFVQAGEYNGTQNANLCIASCTGLKGTGPADHSPLARAEEARSLAPS